MRRRWPIGFALAAFAAFVLWPWDMGEGYGFVLVAHRGVHQTFPLDELTNETCTAAIIHPPAHGLIENTLPSMEAAFRAGADIVELDVHRTADGHLAVFHDWTLDCRTDGHGVTNERTLAELRGLDLGYGYTADGGRTWPLRGTGVGLLRTLPEVLDAFPDGTFALDNKDGDQKTRGILRAFLASRPIRDHRRIHYDGTLEDYAILREVAPQMPKYVFQKSDVKQCLGRYLGMLATGSLTGPCRASVIGVPLAATRKLPGWPHLIVSAAHGAGVPVYVADVDSAADLEEVRGIPLDGIVTNRVEVVGPLLDAEPW